MFGHKSLPSRVYSYGAKVIDGMERVEEQMRLAHRYRNRLVELEINRRRIVDAVLAEVAPTLAAVEAAIVVAESALETDRRTIGRERSRVRSRVKTSEVPKAKSAKTQLNALQKERSAIRKAAFKTDVWRAQDAAIEAAYKVARQEIRSEFSCAGLYWGTYLHVEQSMGSTRSGPPPKFACFDGDGHLAVQNQKGKALAAVIAIEIDPTYSARGGQRRKATVRFRVAGGSSSDPAAWATLAVILHRPIPNDTRIAWAHLIRRRIGTHCEWRLQLVLQRESGWTHADAAGAWGAVGVDVGWRMRPDGSLRVARWYDDEGAEGELALPARWLKASAKVRDLASIRANNLNTAKADLAARMEVLTLPEWLHDAVATFASWKSPARLAALAIRWRAARFDGDSAAFEALEAWRVQDRHLLEYESNLRDQLARERMDLYRCAAAGWRRRYRTIAIEQLDLHDFHERADPEETEGPDALRERVRDACLSALRQCLRETGSVREVPAPNTTRDCSWCGHREQRDGAALMHTCSKCAQVFDQDLNAARNILRSAMQPSAVVAE